MRRLDPFGAMAIGCVVIAAFVEAAQQALTGAPKVTDALPTFATSPKVNYVPLVLLIVAGLLWVIKHSRARPQDHSRSDLRQGPLPPLPEDELNALWKGIHELEGRQLGPGVSIDNSTLTNVTIINQVAPTADQPGKIDYQANVDIRISKTVSVALASKAVTFAALAAIKKPKE